MAHNVNATIKGNKLTIEVDLSDKMLESAPPSGTGKTHLVATTSGSAALVGGPAGRDLKYSLNVMLKK